MLFECYIVRVADEFELGWYRVCATNQFIPASMAKEYRKELRRHKRSNAFDHGLREFIETKCVGCGEKGYFKVGEMGRLSHPGCTTWRMPTAAYIARVAWQVAPVIASLPIKVLTTPRDRHPLKPPPPPKPAGPVCAGCGSPFPEDRRFCPQCGRRRLVKS